MDTVGIGECYHNSLFSLNTEMLVWKELFPTSETSGPMRKANTALLSFDGQLLTVAGSGPQAPSNPSSVAKYFQRRKWVFTNEQHIFDTERGEQLQFHWHDTYICNGPIKREQN